MKILKRLIWFPIGLIRGLLEIANAKARDIENRKKFRNALIDKDCCLSSATTIGINSHILSGCTINNSKIGNYTYVNRGSLIQHTNIGNYCSIANDVIIGMGSHPLDLFSTSPIFYKKKNTFRIQLIEKDYDFEETKRINIGNDVWIGMRVQIMDGINIGDGAVIAAGSIVTKDIPSYAIVAGVPAKILRYRFPEEIGLELLKTKWWENDPYSVQKNNNQLTSIIKAK